MVDRIEKRGGETPPRHYAFAGTTETLLRVLSLR